MMKIYYILLLCSIIKTIFTFLTNYLLIYHFLITTYNNMQNNVIEENMNEIQSLDKLFSRLIQQNHDTQIETMKNKQQRTEFICRFRFMRDCNIPVSIRTDSFTDIEVINEQVRIKFKAEIFEKVINTLRILATQNIFVKGALKDAVKVDMNDTDDIQCVQITPTYLTRVQPSTKQIVDFADFMKVQIQISGSYVQYLFPHQSHLSQDSSIENTALIVNSIKEIDLEQNYNKILLKASGEQIDIQEIFEYYFAPHNQKIINLQGEELEQCLFIILSMFCVQHRQLYKQHYLPAFFNDYIKYDNPKELPDYFLTFLSSIAIEPLHMLRIILGMYPKKLEYCYYTNKFPQDLFNQAKRELPANQFSVLQQLCYLCNEFKEDDTSNSYSELTIKCGRNIECVKKLLKSFM